MDMKTRIAALLAETISAAYPDKEGLPTAETLRGLLEVPPQRDMGDYAFPCFSLAKALRMGPPMIATALANAWQHNDTAAAQALKGYLNFFISREGFAKETLTAVLAAGDQFGASKIGEGKTVCLDYSSINIAKRFHIGHLSTTMIGHSLKRIHDFLGYKTVGINHLGDWGTQFGKMICAYKLWGTKEQVEEGGVAALVDLYVRFHAEAKDDPTLEDQGRMWFKKIEDGDEEALGLWNWFKSLTLRDVAKVYDLLGVEFDSYAGESFYNDKMQPVIDKLKDDGLLTISNGASVVDLTELGPDGKETKNSMPPCIILRSDGATLYATRDLAAALYRQNTYHFDKCLYVVAYQQDLHFKQIFKVLDKMGYPWAKDCVHVAFGMVSFEGQSLSTREGRVIYLEDLLAQAQQKALAIIEEKSPNLPDKETVARQVGIGAVIYTDLSNNRIKDIDFHWDRALNFDGETGPYVQYTHARCCSILRKAAELTLPEADYAALADDEAQELLRQLDRFPDEILEAAAKYEPSIITRAVTDLAQAYNRFYYEHHIIDEEAPAASAARVMLTKAVKDVIMRGLWLIGIEAPERM